MTKPAGELILLPNLLGETHAPELFLPIALKETLLSLDGLIAESHKGFRSFVKRYEERAIRNLPYDIFNKKTQDKDIPFFIDPIVKNERWGLISDAGLCTVADPGARLVHHARAAGIKIFALAGVSSIDLALLLTGLTGQSFTFHGYLPKRENERRTAVEQILRSPISIHICIETPYRNDRTLSDLLEMLPRDCTLAICADLTLPSEEIIVDRIRHLKKRSLPQLTDRQAIFLIKR